MFENKYAKRLLWLIILVIGGFFIIYGNTHEDLWYDESYSVAIANNPFMDILRITSGDSHPPLYYIMLKYFSVLFGKTVFTYRLFSALGIFMLALLGIGPVKRIFSEKTAFVYTVMVFAMPMMYTYAQDVRMYSWAAFFVMASTLYGYLAVHEGKMRYWAIFCILTTAAALTHYFALMAAGVVYLLLLTITITKHRNKIKSIILSGICSLLLFSPWIFFMVSQLKRVKNDFWLWSMGVEDYIRMLVYLFNTKFSPQYIYLIPFFVVSVIFIAYGIKRNNYDPVNGFAPKYAILVYLMTLLSGILVSVLYRPVLYPRYMLVVAGPLILSIAQGISLVKNKKMFALIMASILIFSAIQNSVILKNRYNGNVRECISELSKEISDQDVFIHADGNTFGVLCVYLPNNKHYLYQEKGSRWYSNYDAYKPNGFYGDDLAEFLMNKETVYLVKRVDGKDSVSPRKNVIQIKPDGEILKSYLFKRDESWFAIEVLKTYSKHITY